MSNPSSRLMESIREGIVVVVSILIAFGLDAAWDERQERAREERVLATLAEDMRWNIEELDRATRGHELIRDATQELVRLMDAPPSDVSLMHFDTLMSHTINYWTYDPRIGAIEAVLRELDLIRDPELRAAIAAWPETLRDFREDEERGAAEVDDQILPYVQQPVPIGVRSMDFGFGGAPELPESAKRRLTQQSVRAVLSDLFLANELTARSGRQIVILSEAEDVRSLMVRIVELIDEELGG